MKIIEGQKLAFEKPKVSPRYVMHKNTEEKSFLDRKAQRKAGQTIYSLSLLQSSAIARQTSFLIRYKLIGPNPWDLCGKCPPS